MSPPDGRSRRLTCGCLELFSRISRLSSAATRGGSLADGVRHVQATTAGSAHPITANAARCALDAGALQSPHASFVLYLYSVRGLSGAIDARRHSRECR